MDQDNAPPNPAHDKAEAANRPGTADTYVERVNRAIDFIVANLDQPLSLDSVAAIANFSPFHFHRVFRSLQGETLNQFIKRIRLERALAMLSHGPQRSLTELALACGFASSSDFSRSFKQRYGTPPSQFDLATFRTERRQEWQSAIEDPETRHRLNPLPVGANPDGFRVQLRDLPPRRVAYIRVLDPYRPDVVFDAAERLVAWATERDLAGGQWLGYMWDDPEIVDRRDCRYDVAVEIPHDATLDVGGEVGRFDFPAMCVAEIEVRGPIDLEMRAIDWMFKTWLPNSGFVPSSQPCFEAWIGMPFQHGLEHFELYAHLPISRG